MYSTSACDVVGAHDLGIVEEYRAIPSGHQDRVSILRLDQIAVGEVGGIIRPGETVAGQCGQERRRPIGQIGIRVGEVAECGEGRIVRAYAREPFGSVLYEHVSRNNGLVVNLGDVWL